jgi:hypothetical protein
LAYCITTKLKEERKEQRQAGNQYRQLSTEKVKNGSLQLATE